MRKTSKAISSLLGFLLFTGPSSALTIQHFAFDETGTISTSDGTDTSSVTFVDDAGSPVDLHSADAGGVSGLSGDRSFQNTAPTGSPNAGQGQFASMDTNGYQANQPDNAAIDALGSFSVSGWFKTEHAHTLNNARSRLLYNHDGKHGFNVQFLRESEGDLKLEVDSLSTPIPTEASSGTSGLYAADRTWVFFAINYDSTQSVDNVEFFRGFRNDAEAQYNGASGAAVELVATGTMSCTTCTLDRGPVDDDSAGLVIGNWSESDRPFDGFIDDIRIDDGLNTLATLEGYRNAAVGAFAPPSVARVDEVSIGTSALDQNALPIIVDQLSAVTYNPDTDTFWAVSDMDGALLEIDVEFASDGSILSATPIAALSLPMADDFEGIAYTNQARNSVFLSDEQNPPGIREFDLATGALLQTVGVPGIFSNILTNLGLESLTRDPSGSRMYGATQQALSVDGPLGNSTVFGTTARLISYDVTGNDLTAGEEYGYTIEPLHTSPKDNFGSSLSELVALPDGRLLALERSEAGGTTMTRIFLASFVGADDLSQGSFADGIEGESFTPLGKTLLFFDDGLGKLEGLALGPQLSDDTYALLAVEDIAGENRLHSFTLSFAPEPGALVLLASGVGVLSGLARRRRG